MLAGNSILRRLPAGLEGKQLVFLDGIRHAAEIAWLSYVRLEAVLTWLVDNPSDKGPNVEAYTAAFMDAWCFVDAIDRFRSLWKLLPRDQTESALPQPTFEELSQPIRNLRNVSDHLAQRAEYVAASGNPVMGLLTWVTFPKDTRDEIFTCALAPGTRKNSKWELVNPAGVEFIATGSSRTGMIHLAAGEHRAHLSAIVPEIRSRVGEIEASIESALARAGVVGNQAGTDYFFALRGQLAPPPRHRELFGRCIR